MVDSNIVSQAETGTQPDNPITEKLPYWEMIVLVIGDLLVYFIFALVGRSSHGLSSAGISFIATLNTAMPFMLAWLLAAIVSGTYKSTALYPLWRVILRTLLGTVLAGVLGTTLRAAWLSRPLDLIFMGVAAAFSTLFMLIWRVAWSRFRRLWWPELP